jgi:hypothetical protein
MIKQLRPANDKLAELLEQRAKFLEENPQLAEVQEKIDFEMSKAGKDIRNREAVMRRMIRDTLNEMLEKNQELQNVIKNING